MTKDEVRQKLKDSAKRAREMKMATSDTGDAGDDASDTVVDAPPPPPVTQVQVVVLPTIDDIASAASNDSLSGDWALEAAQFFIDVYHHHAMALTIAVPASSFYDRQMRQMIANDDDGPFIIIPDDEKSARTFEPFTSLPYDVKLNYFLFAAVVLAYVEAFPTLASTHARRQTAPGPQPGAKS